MILSDKKTKNKDSCASFLGCKGRTPFENARLFSTTSATMGPVSYGAISNWMISLRFEKKGWLEQVTNSLPDPFPFQMALILPCTNPSCWYSPLYKACEASNQRLFLTWFIVMKIRQSKAVCPPESSKINSSKIIKSIWGSSFFSKAMWSYTSLFLKNYNSWLFTHEIKQLSLRIRHIMFNQLLWYNRLLKKSFKWTNHL